MLWQFTQLPSSPKSDKKEFNMTAVKNHIKIVGYGTHLPRNTVTFKDQTRYRVVENEETQLSMAVKAIEKALEQAGLTIKDIDCIVSASAVGVQPIPCTAALIHELVAKGLSIPAMDINTTCTSFISALSLMSHLLEAGEYHRLEAWASILIRRKVLSCSVTERLL